ncbi:MAG: type II toxin-antitoxin system VapC family toxin [Defluviitaleaceae bacterium]|nr:type II toxin-antitoxin system VapC family toxin [Defluviitaleaceae bacterium]
MSYMLDTNICIFTIKKNGNVLSSIKVHKNKGLFISAITLSELEHGICNNTFQEKNRMALINFLSLINVPLQYNVQHA